MNKIKIRKAKFTDLETLNEFNLNMALETEELHLPAEKLKVGIASGLKYGRKCTYFVAEIKTEIVGSLMITKEWSDWRNCWIAWIQSVYVKENFRRMGVYSSLYQHIKNIVNLSSEFGGIRLYVDKTNINAQKTYASLGMNGEHYQLFEWMKDY